MAGKEIGMTKLQQQQDQQEVEIQALSEDFYSVEELEERLELATGLVDTLCIGNGCAANGCAGNHDGGGW